MPRSSGGGVSPPTHPSSTSAFSLLANNHKSLPPNFFEHSSSVFESATQETLRAAAAAAMMYGGPLSPLVPVAYPAGTAGYVWPPFAGLFLPYSTPLSLGRPPEALSPERGSTASEQRYTPPEKARIGESVYILW